MPLQWLLAHNLGVGRLLQPRGLQLAQVEVYYFSSEELVVLILRHPVTVHDFDLDFERHGFLHESSREFGCSLVDLLAVQ